MVADFMQHRTSRDGGSSMNKTLLLAAAVLAVATLPAIAADRPVRVVVPAPPPPVGWADLTSVWGWEQTRDQFESCADLAGSLSFGEARLGWMHAPGIAVQLDLHGSSH